MPTYFQTVDVGNCLRASYSDKFIILAEREASAKKTADCIRWQIAESRVHSSERISNVGREIKTP